MKESDFQKSIKEELKVRFPNCVIIKNDPNCVQGFPDLIILWNERWAALECKKDKNANHQPNQDYYVGLLNKLSFSAFIYPENRQEVLDDLERTFKRFSRRRPRVSKSISA